MAEETSPVSRRQFLAAGARLAGLACGAGLVLRLGLAPRAESAPSPGEARLWQIDPRLCIQCGRCATACVLAPSAVKCFHDFQACSYCDRCFGFFDCEGNQNLELDTGAENQNCPTGAIRRRFVADIYYEYTIDDRLCIGCGRCVKGCRRSGNGSLYLQIRQDLCVRCNQCAIAAQCPARAISRVPESRPYANREESPAT